MRIEFPTTEDVRLIAENGAGGDDLAAAYAEFVKRSIDVCISITFPARRMEDYAEIHGGPNLPLQPPG